MRKVKRHRRGGKGSARATRKEQQMANLPKKLKSIPSKGLAILNVCRNPAVLVLIAFYVLGGGEALRHGVDKSSRKVVDNKVTDDKGGLWWFEVSASDEARDEEDDESALKEPTMMHSLMNAPMNEVIISSNYRGTTSTSDEARPNTLKKQNKNLELLLPGWEFSPVSYIGGFMWNIWTNTVGLEVWKVRDGAKDTIHVNFISFHIANIPHC